MFFSVGGVIRVVCLLVCFTQSPDANHDCEKARFLETTYGEAGRFAEAEAGGWWWCEDSGAWAEYEGSGEGRDAVAEGGSGAVEARGRGEETLGGEWCLKSV